MLKNNKGFTLVEMLVAMVIILVLLLGLVQAALLSIDNNLRNLLRDEAVKIAEQRMNELKNKSFNDNDLAATGAACGGGNTQTVTRNFRSLAKDYNVCWIITDLTADTKSLQVVVGWNHKNENPLQAPTGREFQHSVTSILRRS